MIKKKTDNCIVAHICPRCHIIIAHRIKEEKVHCPSCGTEGVPLNNTKGS